MSVLIWATVLFAVRSGSANTVASPRETPEIRAETGLCVVIPCYSTDPDFSLESAVWHKCEDNCTESDRTLLLNNTSPNAQFWFGGRVSLPEPDPSQRTCIIIINDLSKLDSGLYQLLISNKTMAESHGANITVKSLTQKPTVTIPPLTEGQQTTLTCTAPGLCSGSDPKITWMWRGAGEKDSHITGNITAFNTENLTAVTLRHRSTLTFNASAEHHGTIVTCEISFSNNITTKETVTLNVTYVKDPEISGATTVKEGDTLNLTCSVDIYPPSVITWTNSDLNKKLNHESGTDLQNNTGTTTLIIHNVTADHSGQYICTTKHLGKPLTKDVNITVMYVKKFQITGKRTVKKGDTLNLTCSADSYPPSVVTWTKSNSKKKLNDEFGTDPQNNTGTTTLVIHNVTAEHSGQYICTAKHLDILMKEVNVTVIYMEKAEITGNRTVKEGDTLNLTCNVESSPSTYVVWTQVPSNKRLHEGRTNLENNTGTAGLVIPNVTAEDTGQYICTAKHLDMTMTVYANVTVTFDPKILKSSGCEHHLGVLTCACISQGFPLPNIKWPLLKSHNEYSLITMVSKQNKTVNSTIILTLTTPSNTVVECVSSNENGEAKENITINKAEDKGEGQEKKLLRIMTQLETIIAFLIGALLSAIICCLVRKCHRRKRRTYGDLAETLEMVTSQENPLIDAGQAVEDYQAVDQDAAEAGGAMVAEKLDVEYSDLDFSLIKGQSPAEAGTTEGTPETEYAEIKKEKVEERQDGEGEEEEKMIGEDEETKHCVPDEEGGEDVALYSTVKDVMDEI